MGRGHYRHPFLDHQGFAQWLFGGPSVAAIVGESVRRVRKNVVSTNSPGVNVDIGTLMVH